MAKNLYDVLALSYNATEEQIRVRFRELARQRHPDRFQGEEKERAEQEFQEITAAFNVLVDPERRRLHDVELSQPSTQGAITDDAQLTRVYLQRGVKAYKEGNYPEAAENFDRAVKIQPNNAKAWYNLALATSQERRWLGKARSAVVEACRLSPMNSTYLKLAGRIFEAAGMTLRAEQYYNESLKWGGDDAEVVERLEELRKQARKAKSGFFGKVG